MELALVGPWCAARRNHPNLVGLNRPEGIWTNLVDPKEKNSLSYGGRRIACFCLIADGGGSCRSRRRPERILAGIALDLFFFSFFYYYARQAIALSVVLAFGFN